MPQEALARSEEQPTIDRSEKLDAVLAEIAADAEERADRYGAETLVPEGGE